MIDQIDIVEKINKHSYVYQMMSEKVPKYRVTMQEMKQLKEHMNLLFPSDLAEDNKVLLVSFLGVELEVCSINLAVTLSLDEKEYYRKIDEKNRHLNAMQSLYKFLEKC